VRRTRIAGWIAIFAVLLNTFVPMLAQAFAQRDAAAELDLCGQQGRLHLQVLRLQGDAPGKPVPAPARHCLYCAQHGSSFAAPPPAACAATSRHEPASPIARVTSHARPAALRRGNRSRAPPAT